MTCIILVAKSFSYRVTIRIPSNTNYGAFLPKQPTDFGLNMLTVSATELLHRLLVDFKVWFQLELL